MFVAFNRYGKDIWELLNWLGDRNVNTEFSIEGGEEEFWEAVASKDNNAVLEAS